MDENLGDEPELRLLFAVAGRGHGRPERPGQTKKFSCGNVCDTVI